MATLGALPPAASGAGDKLISDERPVPRWEEKQGEDGTLLSLGGPLGRVLSLNWILFKTEGKKLSKEPACHAWEPGQDVTWIGGYLNKGTTAGAKERGQGLS